MNHSQKCPSCSGSFESTQQKCCIKSGFHFPDQIPKLAFSTLPEILEFDFPQGQENQNDRTVVTRIIIPCRSIFGPLVAPSQPRSTNCSARFSVGSDKHGWSDYVLDSDDCCNWMKLVHSAENPGEQNLTAFQFEGHVYFASTRDIQMGEELKVSCSKNYALDLERSLYPSVDVEAGFLEAHPISNLQDTTDSVLNPDGCLVEKTGVSRRDVCLFCQRRYLYAPNLRLHYQSHCSNGKFACPKCDRTFVSLDLAKRHIRKHMVKKLYEYNEIDASLRKAAECDEGGHNEEESESESDAGIQSHGKLMVVPNCCEFCQNIFDSPMELKAHYLTHYLNGQYTCTICRKHFLIFSTAKEHMRNGHPVPQKKFACKVCGIRFSSQLRLDVHAAHHAKERTVKCNQCDRQFKHQENLKQHVRLVHKSRPERKTTYNPNIPSGIAKVRHYMEHTYKCRDCKLGFTFRKQLVQHLEARHPEIPLTSIPELNFPLKQITAYRCAPCYTKFFTEAQYLKHFELKHKREISIQPETQSSTGPSKVKTFKYMAHWCMTCDLAFWGPVEFVRHLRQHPGCLDSIMQPQHNTQATN